MHRSSRFRRLALSLALLPVLSAMAQEAPPAATVEGARTYTPADFARYAPRNALDMLEQVPGFQIREADIERGLGEATGNVLINGQRVSGKSNDVLTQLGSIPAGNVVRIEIRDGATLDIPGLSGQVANVVSKAGGISGQWSWNPDVRRFFTDPQLTRGEVSISGAKGGLDWTLGFANQANHSGAGGETLIYNADGSFRDFRYDEWTGEADRPRLSGSLAWTGPTGQLANLNMAYQRVYFDYVEDGTRSGPGLPDRARSVRYEEGGYNHEIGGDYEFALGAGRLKLIGLNSFVHLPLSETVVTRTFDGVTQDGGSRFTRAGDCTDASVSAATTPAEADLVDIATLVPGIGLDIRYAGSDNFVGTPVDGYHAPKCYLRTAAARALAKVEADLRLLLGDYIAPVSGHSRGFTVDLTLQACDAAGCAPLDMGTPFDFFDPRANTDSPDATAAQRANRDRLREAMRAAGFANYPLEWWHFTLDPLPSPAPLHDVPVH